MNKKYEIDMCSGSVFGKMLLFALPLMCSSILQLLFNAADIVVVGRFAGDNALAAVGVEHGAHQSAHQPVCGVIRRDKRADGTVLWCKKRA